MPGFTYDAGQLTCDGVPLALLADEAGTPCYVYSGGTIRQRVAALTAAFAPVPHTLHYALKANSTMAIVRLLRSLGCEADANSGGEIEVALRAGFIPDQIVFTGVGKSRDELERGVTLGLKAINAESAGELARIADIAEAQNTRARVALRVNPDIDAQSHPHISTGLKRNKFGVALEAAVPLLTAMAGRRGLEIVGIHAHVGSQITSIEPLARAARTLADIARALIDAGLPLQHIDVGGGVGIDYDGTGIVVEPGEYARAVMDATRPLGLALILEPGRNIVGPAGVLVATVVDVKEHPGGRRFVVLDAGMTELLRPALYGAYHRIVPLVADGRPPIVCDVVGPVCESSDTFGVDRTLPDPQVGDRVAVLDTGAYGAVMASMYNRRPLPPEMLVDEGQSRLVRRRLSVDDMLMAEA